MLWVKIVIAFTLILIAYEDFKSRSVRLVYFILLAVLVLILRLNMISTYMLLETVLVNLAYVTLLFSSAFVVLYVKNGRRSPGIFQAVGPGDIFLLSIFAFCLDTVWFVVFTTSSLTLSLVAHLILVRFPRYGSDATIPLAGMQSLCFLPLLILL